MQTSTVYALNASGLAPAGCQELMAQVVKQVRLIVRDPVYMSRNSHRKVLEDWNTEHPIAAPQKSMHKEKEPDP